MRRARRVIAIAAFTLASCSSQVLPASTPTSDAVILRLYTTTATVRLTNALTLSYARLYPSVSFDILVSNYEGVVDRVGALEQVYFVTSHLPPIEEVPLWAAPIGQDGIAIITHPDNPVSDLSLPQLRAVYQGKITNWRELGGADHEIIVISREAGSGTRAEFERLVMGTRDITQSAIIAPSSAAVVTSVSREPNALGYVSMSYIESSVQAVRVGGALLTRKSVYDNTYPLRTTLFIAGLEEPQPEAYRMFIGWVQSQPGQAIVASLHAPLLMPEAGE